MTAGRGIRVLVSMIGLDSHTTGAEVVAALLRDSGFEVVYLGTNQTPEMIVNAAVDEDVDIIGISSHASNFVLIEDLIGLLEKRGLSEVPVVCGGNVPPRQIEKLLARGVARVFTPGSSAEAIVEYLAGLGRRG